MTFASGLHPLARHLNGDVGRHRNTVQSVDYIYWTFSSAAQSISAFAALLLTGYAIVHSYVTPFLQTTKILERN
jgi:hypothetical protein